MERTRDDQPTFTAPRDQDELEGALLLPTASSITAPCDSASHGAVPLARFDYDQVIVSDSDLAESSDHIDHIIPTAPPIPSYDTIKDRERAMLQQVAVAARRGLQIAEIEKEKLRKAETNVYAINYHADRKVEEANRLARERDRQGLEIEKDKWFGHETQARPRDAETVECPPAFPVDHKGGYEVSEYKPSEHSFNTEYNISEYKSVYD
jgi:hypothetical protein